MNPYEYLPGLGGGDKKAASTMDKQRNMLDKQQKSQSSYTPYGDMGFADPNYGSASARGGAKFGNANDKSKKATSSLMQGFDKIDMDYQQMKGAFDAFGSKMGTDAQGGLGGLPLQANKKFEFQADMPKLAEGREERMKGLGKAAIRRLARRGGVKRISAKIHKDCRDAMGFFLESTLQDALTYTTHAKRSTVKPSDIVNALKRRGRQIYGYGN
ncbi:unnamed protein product [Amoebophrya sp. A120]|nr:unnamed protein product [Amoebophrya sp. A120]|eukprot:GSA120T00015856001.1